MIRQEMSEEFKHQLDRFNDSQGPPSKIVVAWNPKGYKREIKKLHGVPVYEYDGRWQVFAVPITESTHPLAKNSRTKPLMRPVLDTGEDGVLLFTWCQRGEDGKDCGYMPLDSRLFDALIFADSFRDREHFNKTIKNPELEKEKRDIKTLQAIMGAGQEYWKGLDSLTISLDPSIKAGADWRGARARWR